ncbi:MULTISPECIES: hypothetical protein [unclassified Variovorax]|uniref:hypothetical protein n=1 Tax=unclassified Variovorax TaxID=663243 RepID=UPI003F4741F6
MKFIKYWGIRVTALLCAIALWFSTAYWLPLLSSHIASLSPECKFQGSSECEKFFSKLGTTGDLFGSVTSLFSGLALFAVAITLWADSRARREGLKPLVIANIEEKVGFERAMLTEPKKIDFIAAINISNQTSDTALNVFVTGKLKCDDCTFDLPEIRLEAPLVQAISRKLEVRHALSGQELPKLLATLTEENKFILLTLITTYESLENVAWSTSVVYELRCLKQDDITRLNVFRAGNQVAFDEQWSAKPLVLLESQVQKGSWKHKKIH